MKSLIIAFIVLFVMLAIPRAAYSQLSNDQDTASNEKWNEGSGRTDSNLDNDGEGASPQSGADRDSGNDDEWNPGVQDEDFINDSKDGEFTY